MNIAIHPESKNTEPISSEALLHELAQCREDERASKAQIFQILSTTATFLTIVTTISGVLSSQNTQSRELYVILYLLTILVVTATVSYIANLGLLSTFRHHYMVDIERCLYAQEHLLHWETISKPLITLNPKRTGIFSLFRLNAHIAFVSVLALALVFIIMQMIIILGLFPQLASIIWSGLVCYVLVLFICAITLAVSMNSSNKLYHQAREKATTKNWTRPKTKMVSSPIIFIPESRTSRRSSSSSWAMPWGVCCPFWIVPESFCRWSIS